MMWFLDEACGYGRTNGVAEYDAEFVAGETGNEHSSTGNGKCQYCKYTHYKEDYKKEE